MSDQHDPDSQLRDSLGPLVQSMVGLIDERIAEAEKRILEEVREEMQAECTDRIDAIIVRLRERGIVDFIDPL